MKKRSRLDVNNKQSLPANLGSTSRQIMPDPGFTVRVFHNFPFCLLRGWPHQDNAVKSILGSLFPVKSSKIRLQQQSG